jgi:membrane fusion protein, multidrug efflux system
MKKIIVVLIILITAGSILVSCSNKGGSNQAKKDELAKLKKELVSIQSKIKTLETELKGSGDEVGGDVIKVDYIEIQPNVFRRFLKIQGVAESEKLANLSFKMGGTIVRLYVNEGSFVKKGTLIAESDAEVLYKTLKEVEGSYDFVLNVYNKQKNLYEQKVISEIQYLESKNNKESLERKIETLKRQIQDAKLYAPFDGVIDRLFPKVGEMSGPGMPVAQLSGAGSMKIVANVSESYVSTFKPGDDVKINFTDLGKQIDSKIGVVSKVIDTRNRTFRIEMASTNLPEGVRPNMICSIDVNDVAIPNSISVPISSVQNSENGKYVYVIQENSNPMVKKRFIKTGLTAGEFLQVIEGLNPGEKVVTEGVLDVSDGQRVAFN